MRAILLDRSRTRITAHPISLRNGLVWGMLGGLVATVVMDLALIGSFAAAGMPPFTCFFTIGDTVARVFSSPDLTGSVPLGAAAHYLIGPALGALFGAALRRIPALRAGSRKKTILFAVLYTEILSQPMLALTPVLLRMTASQTLLWFGGSFGMHLIWGCILGLVISNFSIGGKP